ncbi:MAG: hypothetical protein JXL97_08840 [Bacteroidales bacterium]|nr:hypothetical protein [Bacteroidales bacterium]
MKLFYKLFVATIVVLTFQSCDFYRDWNEYVDYSEAYPICGEYMVRDFESNDDLLADDPYNDWYHIYIYNKSYNPTHDSIWIDNRTGHPVTGPTYNFKYKIKCKADTIALSFDTDMAGDIIGYNVNPLDTCVHVTIANSKIWDVSDDISDPTPDSIYFEFTYYNKAGTNLGTFITTGHRKTGWEEIQNDDNM